MTVPDGPEATGPDNAGQPVSVMRAIAVVGIALSLFQLYAAGIQPLGLFIQRPIHLGFILVLCFLIYPVTGTRPRGALGWAIDGPLILGGVLVGYWVPANHYNQYFVQYLVIIYQHHLKMILMQVV
jgi:TRAP-type uncharacterized transport system fused permease subunit